LRLGASEGAGKKRAGFTLVEVIVVLVILAILAAIAIPALTGYIDKAKQAEIKSRAREFVVARQTLLAEAYADPQTVLSGVTATTTNPSYMDPNTTGALYVDGALLAYTQKIGDLYRVGFKGDEQNSYTYSDGTNKGSRIVGIKPDSPTLYGAGPMWKLTHIPTINYEYPPSSKWAVATSGRGTWFMNSGFTLVAYVYVDPAAWTYDASGWLNDTYAYVYNLNYKDDDTMMDPDVDLIDTDLGYKMWRYTFADNKLHAL
jgi:prepilin-type N-terminal cleavage/methylation domain-containing protein